MSLRSSLSSLTSHASAPLPLPQHSSVRDHLLIYGGNCNGNDDPDYYDVNLETMEVVLIAPVDRQGLLPEKILFFIATHFPALCLSHLHSSPSHHTPHPSHVYTRHSWIASYRGCLSFHKFRLSFIPGDHSCRVGHAAVTLPDSNTVYVFGGWNGKAYLNFGCLFDCDQSTVLVEKGKARTLPSARRDHTLVCVPSSKQCWLFGGWNNMDVDDAADMWTLDQQWVWEHVTDMVGQAPSALRGHSTCVVGDILFVFAGLQGLTTYTNDLYLFHTHLLKWLKVPCGGYGAVPAARAWHTASLIGGRFMVLFGGTAGRMNFFNDVHVLDVTTLTWHRVAMPSEADEVEQKEDSRRMLSPTPRASHTAVAVGMCTCLCFIPLSCVYVLMYESMLVVRGAYIGRVDCRS